MKIFNFRPLTQRRINSFKGMKRSYYSLLIIIGIFAITGVSELICNNKPIIASYQGKILFPTFKVYQGLDFGTTSHFEPNYKDLALNRDDIFMIWPLLKWGYNESNSSVASYPSPPTKDNLLGTDNRGRDVLTRIIYGIRVSLLFALMNYLVAVIFGTIIGGTQGFVGGKVDLVGQRLVEIWSALPYFLVLILLGSIFQPGFWVLVLIAAMFSWIELSYYVRAECLKIRKEDFVNAATALGASQIRNLFKHVFPNAITPIITFSPFLIVQGILTLSFLDFLGFGVQPPTASLGELLDQGRQNFMTAWWLALFPFLTLVTLILLLNFVGEGVRAAFDPRKHN